MSNPVSISPSSVQSPPSFYPSLLSPLLSPYDATLPALQHSCRSSLFNLADNFLSHTTPNALLQPCHPACTLLLTSSSQLPSTLTTVPRYLKWSTFFTFFPCIYAVPCSAPRTWKQLSSIFLRILQAPLYLLCAKLCHLKPSYLMEHLSSHLLLTHSWLWQIRTAECQSLM